MLGSLQNQMYAQMEAKPDFKVGDGATILSWTDRHACTIVEISNKGKTIVLQSDKATRTDSNGRSDAQSYDYESNPEGAKNIATRRKDGLYRLKGGKLPVLIGDRHEYYDYSF